MSRRSADADRCIIKLPSGSWQLRLTVGSSPNRRKYSTTFPASTSLLHVRSERDFHEARLRSDSPDTGTLAGDVAVYLLEGSRAQLTPATRTIRTQQLAWWCAQPAAIGADVLSWSTIKAERALREQGKRTPSRGRTLGELPRSALSAERLAELLLVSWPVDPRNPAKSAETSNKYRLALWHVFVVLDAFDASARNPLKHVKPRQGADPGDYGADMRVVAMILAAAGARSPLGGHEATLTSARAAVLAFVHIRESQLMELQPEHFHDVPDATRADYYAGAVTLTIPPHFKGRKGRRLPPPKTVPVTAWGAHALRAFFATKGAPGSFSMSSLNKWIKRGARMTSDALADKGLRVDLSRFTTRHLRHSLATALDLATQGDYDPARGVVLHDGVREALGHADAKTSRIYTQSAVHSALRYANKRLAFYLEDLSAAPLVAGHTSTTFPAAPYPAVQAPAVAAPLLALVKPR